VLFLLIGLEVLVLHFERSASLFAVATVPVVIGPRFIAVGALAVVDWSSKLMSRRNVPFLTWAGIRGGISVALALSIPTSEAKGTILAATYAVVLFSIVIQGLTLGPLVRRVVAVKSP